MKRIRGPEIAGVATFILHALAWGRYGLFRDELYFIACGERLSVGYVDQPPLIALIARLSHALFGLWVPGLRLLPWIASAVTVWLAGRLALRLGAGPVGATVASVATLACPLLLGLGHMLTMNAFEPLLWTALALVLVRIVSGEDRRLWVLAGLIAAVGILNKYSAAPFAVMLGIGLVATPERRMFVNRWFPLSAAAALLIVLPNLLWQAAHGFPFLELVHNGQLHKNTDFSLGGFFGALLLQSNPIATPLWLGGLAWLLVAKAARPHRFLGIGALLLLVFLTVSKAKAYYVTPLFPLLFSAGGAAMAPMLASRRWMQWAVPSLVIVVGAVGWPMAVPLLPKETFVAYQDALGMKPPPTEKLRLGALPQVWADMFGWEELAHAVADVAKTLSPEERAQAVVFGQNYGEASAIELYRDALGLPPAVSGHNQYYQWGIPEGRGDVLIVISDKDENCGNAFRHKEVVKKLPSNPWVIPYEDERWIWICRDPIEPLQSIWPKMRFYI